MGPLTFYIYLPEDIVPRAKKLMHRLGVAGRLSYRDFLRYYSDFGDLGEINNNYKGLQELAANLILVAVDRQNNPLGFCLFKINEVDLVEIDIIAVRNDLRCKGLGKKLYARLEQGFVDGTVFYVENNTFAGGLFFKSCGFFRDVDLIKKINADNRLAAKKSELPDRLLAVC